VLSVANDHDFEKIYGSAASVPLQPMKHRTSITRCCATPPIPITASNGPCAPRTRLSSRARWCSIAHSSRKASSICASWGIVYSLIFLSGFVTLQRALRSVPLALSTGAQAVWIVVVCNAAMCRCSIPLTSTPSRSQLSPERSPLWNRGPHSRARAPSHPVCGTLARRPRRLEEPARTSGVAVVPASGFVPL